MQKQRTENFQKGIHSFIQQHSTIDDQEEELYQDPDHALKVKIDKMINTKRGPVKKFNNNPPKREVPPKKVDISNETGAIEMDLNQLKGMARGSNTSPDLRLAATSDKKRQVQQSDQQFLTFQTKQMYNQESILQFGSADTKMKQLQMKLRETEQQNLTMSIEHKKLIREMKGSEGNLSKNVQLQLETLLVDIINDMSVMFREHEHVCEQHGQTQIELLEMKES